VRGAQVVTLLTDKNAIPSFSNELFIFAEGEDTVEMDGTPHSIICWDMVDFHAHKCIKNIFPYENCLEKHLFLLLQDM